MNAHPLRLVGKRDKLIDHESCRGSWFENRHGNVALLVVMVSGAPFFRFVFRGRDGGGEGRSEIGMPRSLATTPRGILNARRDNRMTSISPAAIFLRIVFGWH
jgi:hypothetical protein